MNTWSTSRSTCLEAPPDTHAFLWFIFNDAQLSAATRTVISDPQNDVFVSPATYWEIAIKVSIGKYTLQAPFEDFIRHAIKDNDFDILPIEIRHAAQVATLPMHHKDPFDRILIAQTLVEGLTLSVTRRPDPMSDLSRVLRCSIQRIETADSVRYQLWYADVILTNISDANIELQLEQRLALAYEFVVTDEQGRVLAQRSFVNGNTDLPKITSASEFPHMRTCGRRFHCFGRFLPTCEFPESIE